MEEEGLTVQTSVAEDEENQNVRHRYTAGEFEGPLDLLLALIRDNKHL